MKTDNHKNFRKILQSTLILIIVWTLLGANVVQAAITHSLLLTGSDVAHTQAIFTTASMSPDANQLIVVTVVARASSGIVAPTVTGNGLNYVQINSVLFGTIAAPEVVTAVYRAMGSSPSAGALTIDFGSATPNTVIWSVSEFDGVDTSGTDGSGAIAQSQTNRADSGTSLSITLGALGASTNATFGALGHTADETAVEGGGFAELSDVPAGGKSRALETEWQNPHNGDTTVDWTSWTTNTANGGVAVEINSASAGGGGSSSAGRKMRLFEGFKIKILSGKLRVY